MTTKVLAAGRGGLPATVGFSRATSASNQTSPASSMSPTFLHKLPHRQNRVSDGKSTLSKRPVSMQGDNTGESFSFTPQEVQEYRKKLLSGNFKNTNKIPRCMPKFSEHITDATITGNAVPRADERLMDAARNLILEFNKTVEEAAKPYWIENSDDLEELRSLYRAHQPDPSERADQEKMEAAKAIIELGIMTLEELFLELKINSLSDRDALRGFWDSMH